MNPAEAQALPHEGTSAPACTIHAVLHMVKQRDLHCQFSYCAFTAKRTYCAFTAKNLLCLHSQEDLLCLHSQEDLRCFHSQTVELTVP